jgi:hypothetical protein
VGIFIRKMNNMCKDKDVERSLDIQFYPSRDGCGEWDRSV